MIDKTKELEQRILEQRKLFETIFYKSVDGLSILEDGKFTNCNDALLKMLKYKNRDDFLNAHPSQHSPQFQPDKRESFEKANEMMRLTIKKGSHSFEWMHTRADKENFWAEIVLTDISTDDKNMIHVSWRDIDDRKKAEFELEELTKTLEEGIQEATHELKKAHKIAKIGSWQLQIRTDMLAWDDETYSILEVDKKKLPIASFKDFSDLIHPEDLQKVTEAYETHLKDNKPYRIIHRILTKNGNIKYVEERCETIFDEDGDPIISDGTIQDITEQKLAQLNLQQKEQQLLSQSRLAQMGEMLSMIAHQWRQPLTAISATTNNLTIKLMMDNFDKKEFEKEISLIAGYSQHLSRTIDDFRGFFKENKEKEITTLEEIVNSVLDISKISIENKNIKLITSFNCNKKLKTYSSELRQVLLNLIKNAQDVLIDREIKNPTITIDISCEREYIVKVKDNAGGIPEDIKDKIFDPYFSTKKEKDGTGLGLYMSKTIIEKHCEGKLTVSNDSEGAVFKISLKESLS